MSPLFDGLAPAGFGEVHDIYIYIYDTIIIIKLLPDICSLIDIERFIYWLITNVVVIEMNHHLNNPLISIGHPHPITTPITMSFPATGRLQVERQRALAKQEERKIYGKIPWN